MTSALRAQVALIGLLACLLIPISTSSLRGLTHVLTCDEATAASVSLLVDSEGRVIPSESNVLTRGEDGEVPTQELCGGLTVTYVVRAEQPKPNASDVTIEITNNSEYGWRGSVQLDMNGVEIPIDIGEIAAGATASDDFTLHLDEDKSYEISGNLLIGP